MMNRYNLEVNKNFELEFTMKQYGSEYSVSRKYWHSDPPDMELGMEFFLSAMKLLGWGEEDVAYHFYDVVREQMEREKRNSND